MLHSAAKSWKEVSVNSYTVRIHVMLVVELCFIHPGPLQIGSRGSSVFSGLHYWCSDSQMQIAPYHNIYLGEVPDFFSFLKDVLLHSPNVSRLKVTGAKSDADIPAKVFQARMSHFVLRTWPSCRVVDYFSHKGSMIIEEWQLFMETASVYLMHDMATLGLHGDVLVMWYVFYDVRLNVYALYICLLNLSVM